jgi:hypothetical protein
LTNDPFFSPGDNWEWNACIGDQGDEQYYINGYIEAAIELVDAIFEKKLYGKRDTLVLPILYNARHAIELALKMAIRELKGMGVLNSAPLKNHDILAHWRHLDSSNLGDEWLKKIVAEIKPFVLSLAQIDEDGQEFRYHETRDGDRSLRGQSVANLAVIRESLNLLQEALKSLMHRLYCLDSERKGGFFTPDLSRNDLVRIASSLPDRDDWNTPQFDCVKEDNMIRYSIGARKYAEALKLIQQNRETRGLIGMETVLRYLSDDKARLLTEKHLALWPPPKEGSKPRIIKASEINYEAMTQASGRERGAIQELLDQLSCQEIADVSVAFYIGLLHEIPEIYEVLLDTKLETLKTRKSAEAELIHVFRKSNFRVDLAHGLQRLGRIQLARELLR